MRIAPLVLLLVIAGNLSFAQQKRIKQQAKVEPVSAYAAIDGRMLAIPAEQTNTTADVANYINANFSSARTKVRAIYAFTTSSFEYDYDNMFAINFYDKKENKADKMMKLRKGICENYAAVFNELCLKCGIRSYMIGGYTRQYDFTSYLPHAWCGAVVDNEYYLFDPTWGSGYISNRKFVKKRNDEYFMQAPAELIKTHMPFDPMWQLLYYPVTAREFEEGKTISNKSKGYFSFPDTITAYDKMSLLEQYESEARRIEQNGIKTALVYNQLANVKQNIDIERQNYLVNTYNSAVADYNQSLSDLSVFINYRNKQFSPSKPDTEIQGMMDTVDRTLMRAGNKLAAIKGKDKQVDAMISPMERQMNDVGRNVSEQKELLRKYFHRGKIARKSMLYKLTWLGIPVTRLKG
jgi:transglutaminase/protease-like cytokinesis protein 3